MFPRPLSASTMDRDGGRRGCFIDSDSVGIGLGSAVSIPEPLPWSVGVLCIQYQHRELGIPRRRGLIETAKEA